MSTEDPSNEGLGREPTSGSDASSNAYSYLQAFLAWLGPDKYVQLHRKLVFYFECRRCARRCEELADKTLDRVARKFAAGETPDREHIDSYVLRGAWFIWKEDPGDLPAAPPDPPDRKQQPSSDPEQERCLEKCLSRLQREDQQLVLRFYHFQGRQKADDHKLLAKRLGVSVNALRVRVHRIRERLRGCCITCLEEGM